MSNRDELLADTDPTDPASSLRFTGIKLVRSAASRLAWCHSLWKASRVLPDEETSAEQFESFRRMSAAQRLALAEALYWSAREWKALGLRRQHGDWTDKEISAEVTRLFLHART